MLVALVLTLFDTVGPLWSCLLGAKLRPLADVFVEVVLLEHLLSLRALGLRSSCSLQFWISSLLLAF